MEVQATELRTSEDLRNLRPGSIYITHSTFPAYFPAMAMIVDERAAFLGENYDMVGRWVTLQTKGAAAGLRGLAEFEFQHRVTLGPDFFVKALNDYADWEVKWWREVVQNSVDGGATVIKLGVERGENGTVMPYCDDNGRGMDKETLLTKFLQMGGSTKDDAVPGTTGGFGKAKELIILPWIGWRVDTQDIMVEGVGDTAEGKAIKYRRGTRVQVIMSQDKATSPEHALQFLARCYLPNIDFYVDGKKTQIHKKLTGGNLVRSLPNKLDIYHIPDDSGLTSTSELTVRANGIFMFDTWASRVPGRLYAEITGSSVELLAANRDGFRDKSLGNLIYQLGQDIAKNTRSALLSKKGLVTTVYKGTGKFKIKEQTAEALEQIGPINQTSKGASLDWEAILQWLQQNRDTLTQGRESFGATEANKAIGEQPSAEAAATMLDTEFRGPAHVENAVKQMMWAPDIAHVNEVENFKTPAKFKPATMKPQPMKLLKVWTELCRFVLIQLGSSEEYGVGFIFSNHTAAALWMDKEEQVLGKWLVLNPYKDAWEFVHNPNAKIWSPSNKDDLKWLYAAAIHEVTHLANNAMDHDEDFSSALTKNMAICADGFRKIRKIVGAIKMRGGVEAGDVPIHEQHTPD